jgi:hypothetical protein
VSTRACHRDAPPAEELDTSQPRSQSYNQNLCDNPPKENVPPDITPITTSSNEKYESLNTKMSMKNQKKLKSGYH